MNQGSLTERHFIEILGVCIDSHLSDWLTTEQVQAEIIEKAAKEKWSARTLGKEFVTHGSLSELHLRQIVGLLLELHFPLSEPGHT